MSNHLYEAAYQGDVGTVRSILAQKEVDPYVADADGNYPFMAALILPASSTIEFRRKKQDCFNLLRPEYAELKCYCDISGNTMVHYLSKYGYGVALLHLIRQAEISRDYSIFFMGNHFDQKPIYLAIMQKEDEIVDTLLKIPNMNTIEDWNNRNLIHHMAQYGTAAMLRSYCASLPTVQLAKYINMVDVDGKTPYLLARDCNGSNERADIMDILVAQGAVPVRSFSPFG